MLLLAHNPVGLDGAGLSPGVVLVGTVIGLGLLTLALRVSVAGDGFGHQRVPEAVRFGDQNPPATVGTAVAVLLLGLIWSTAWFGSSIVGTNPAPVAVFATFLTGMLLVSVLVGDVWSQVDPVAALADGVDRLLGRPAAADPVKGGPAAPLLLGLYAWWLLAYPDGLEPRRVALWLTLHLVVLLGGGVVRGAAWTRANDPFRLLFSAVGRVSPVTWVRRGLPGRFDRTTTAVLVVAIGATFFDALSFSEFWADLVRVRSRNGVAAYNTVGLAWMIGLVAAGWAGVTRLGARLAGEEPPAGTGALSVALAPIAAAVQVAHDLTAWLLDSQDLVALLSDPFGRGVDLLGTTDLVVDDPLSLTTAAVVQLALLLVGLGAAIVIGHQRALVRFGAAPGLRAEWPVVGFVVVLGVAGLRLLLGT